MPVALDIPAAVAVFAHGFAFQRSRTHPFVAERCGPLWVLRDAPRKRGPYRREEWLAAGQPPAEVDAQVRAGAGERFVICAIHPLGTPYEPLRDAYKALGYRLAVTEALMVHGLDPLPELAPPPGVEVVRVTTGELAARVNQGAGRTQIAASQLHDDDPQRQFAALLDGEPAGWVGSVLVPGGLSWCTNMFVRPEFRRRGIARALLAAMLADDLARGSGGSVLLASHTGARLYPVVGYEPLGTLLAFNPMAPRAGA